MIALFFKRLFSRKGNIRMIPDNEQVEEQTNEEVADTPPAEDAPVDPPAEEEAPPADPPVDATPVTPAMSIDETIALGAMSVQDTVSAFRASKTVEHDARMALTAAQAESQRILADAQAQIDAADGAEDDALAEANAAIDAQIANLQALKTAINA